MKPRLPQLALRLETAAHDTETPWRAGGSIAFLGGKLILVLDTACPLPERVGTELHLPLPPAATPRQIRDAAESWLRLEAQRHFAAVAAAKSAPGGRRPPRIVLAYGRSGDWVRVDGDSLRCHWRLIEQPKAVVAQVLERAIAQSCREPVSDDLFAPA